MRIFASLVFLIFTGFSALPAEAAGYSRRQSQLSREQKEIVERIYLLKGEIDALYLQLPSRLQREVRGRLEEYPAATRRPGQARSRNTLHSALTRGGSGLKRTGLEIFDSNGDGEVSRFDTTFQYLRIWWDRDADGEMDFGETVSMHNAGIESLDRSGREFRDLKGAVFSMQLGEKVVLDLAGDGFDRGGPSWNSDDAFLALDADAMRPAGYEIRTAAGGRVRGTKALARGWKILFPDGKNRTLAW